MLNKRDVKSVDLSQLEQGPKTSLGRQGNEASDHIKKNECTDKISASISFSKVIQSLRCHTSANFMVTNFKFMFKTALSEAMKHLTFRIPCILSIF